MAETKVIVVTLVKDEGWMLDRFLATCSHFADYIIVSDESSGIDDSLDIYKKYPKSIVHYNSGPPVRGDLRRQFVFEEARKISCEKRIIVAIDSDEILSANLLDSPEWKTVISAEPGTLIHLQWVNLWKNIDWYKVEQPLLYGTYNRTIWIDDGVSTIPVQGYQEMHMAYTPLSAIRHIYLRDIVCLHYQFCNWTRMEAKHRYYRAHEKADIKKLSDLGIARMYGYMRSRQTQTAPTLERWFSGWQNLGIDMSSTTVEEFLHYDLSVLELIDKHGADTFAFQDIWTADWDKIISWAKTRGYLPEDYQFKRPKRSLLHRIFGLYVRKTIDSSFVRKLEMRIFKKGFWY